MRPQARAPSSMGPGAPPGAAFGVAGYQLLHYQIRPLLVIAVVPALAGVLLVAALRELTGTSAPTDSPRWWALSDSIALVEKMILRTSTSWSRIPVDFHCPNTQCCAWVVDRWQGVVVRRARRVLLGVAVLGWCWFLRD